MKSTAYLMDRLFTGEAWLDKQAVITYNGEIKNIIPQSQVDENYSIQKPDGAFLAPAFIDAQIYGAHEKLFAVWPNISALEALRDYCKRGGATLFQPTVATNQPEVFYKCIDAVRAYWQEGGKGVLGLHLEGPWINPVKRGAHIEELIHAPALEEVKAVLDYGKGVITMITLAPEVCSKEVIAYIQSQNIIISAGHSNATYAEATQAFNLGIPTATHLYNAMSPLQHREPGFVGAVFNHAKVRSSIIPDGHHVDFAAIKIAKKLMGERLFAITDAVTETIAGPYPHHLEGDKYVSNGILSGSALTMHKAFYNLVHQANVDIEEALRMCSLYPAQALKLDERYGKIAPGYVAQFVVLNKQLQLLNVISE